MKTKVVKRYGSFVVQFTQGVQTFHIPNLEKTKTHAIWQKKMLDKAFENFKDESQLQPIEVDNSTEAEISNEEINLYAETYPNYLHVRNFDRGMKQGIKNGARWYRDQLKNK